MRKFFRKVFYVIIHIVLFLPSRILYPVKIIHKNRLPKKSKYVAVCNHLHFYDPVSHILQIPGFRYLIAKKELSKNWFVRWVSKTVGLIFVDRGNTDIATIKEILNVLKQNRALAIFPEGTRNKVSRELLEIKSGAGVFAVKGQAPVIPMVQYRRFRAFRKNYWYVGEAFDLSEFYGKKMTAEAIAECDAKIRAHMLDEMAKMDDYVQNKRWKKKNRLPEAKTGSLDAAENTSANVIVEEPHTEPASGSFNHEAPRESLNGNSADIPETPATEPNVSLDGGDMQNSLNSEVLASAEESGE